MLEQPSCFGDVINLQLEDFGSVGLLKVMEIITRHGPLNISMLARRAGLNHSSVDRHIKKLVDMELVTDKRYNHIRMIKPAFASFTIQFKRALGVKFTVEAQR